MDPERPEQPHDPDGELVEAELVVPVEPTSRLDSLIDAGGRVVTPVAWFGFRSVRRVGRRLGVNRAVSRVVDRGVDRALESETVERAAEKALDSELVDRVWQKVLESDEAQQLVERVAEAPEVRSAITSQGVGLAEDMRRSIRRAGRTLDDRAERVVRRLLRRRRRTGGRPIYAGFVTRLLALALDAALLTAALGLTSAVLASLANALFAGDGLSVQAIAVGAAAWWVAVAVYLMLFWTLVERTPGMTFMGLRILSEDGGHVPPRQDIRRLIGLVLAAIPFCLGFLGVFTEERRRGWHDRFAHTVVLYADPELDQGVDPSGRLSNFTRR
ncbi:MAG TPA: RDD family protein [Solirubrobacterales bacterium]|jgi:uncharacterized RDD family membrane protein YckC|nr:RDD family protein [Solirubrobacterales bacterium]